MKRICVSVGLLLFGCSDDGGGNEPIALEDFSLALSTASCDVQFECCTAAEIMAQYMGITFEGEPITTEEQCVTFSNAVFSSFGVARYEASIALGRMEFDGAAAAECVAAIEDVTCAQYSSGTIDVDSSCRPFLLPKVGDGGACTQDYECTSRNCVGEDVPLEGESTDGACEPFAGPGEPCDDNCAPGQYCRFDPMSSDPDTCQDLEADGEACIRDSDCVSDFCGDTDLCEPKPVTCTGA